MFLTVCTYANLNCLKELFLCMKMDLGLYNRQTLICDKAQTNKRTNIINSWRKIGNIRV